MADEHDNLILKRQKNNGKQIDHIYRNKPLNNGSFDASENKLGNKAPSHFQKY